MTNIEAKQEAIKKAYGEYFIHADKNGWIRYLMYCPSDLGIENYDDIDGFWRCNSLQGIENNNGWIRIESESDLPNGTTECRTCFYDGKNYVEGIVKKRSPEELLRLKYINEITHYQLIEKPKLPIF